MAKKLVVFTPNVLWIMIGVLLISLALLGAYMLTSSSKSKQKDDDHDRVCLPKSAYDKLMKPPTIINKIESIPASPSSHLPTTTQTQDRDYRVLADPLYPPLNRVETDTYDMLQKNIQQRAMMVPTSVRETRDTYRLVGYLVNKDDNADTGGNNWKLMARMKDKNTADFYIIPANRNYDMKINITDEIVDGTRLRDIYTIPHQVKFKSPLLNQTPYDFVEVEKSDLTYTNGGMYM